MTTTNVTPEEADDGLINTLGARWAGSTITYSVPGAGAVWVSGYGRGEAVNADYGTLDPTQTANFLSAVRLWDSYIAPTMTSVPDSTPGDIRVAFTDATELEGNPNISAYAYGPSTGGVTPQAGDVWLDETLKSSTFAQGTSGFELLLHELGHSLGLKHPFDNPTLPAGYDNKIYTVMSYTNADYLYTFSGGGGSIFVSFSGTTDFTPMVLDILAIQDHYGADTTTYAGDTNYLFLDTGLYGRQAIYDSGGTDTLDLSALSRGSRIDLRPGAYSDVGYYSVAAQEEDLVAQYGEGFRSFIHSQLNDPSRPAYEWDSNLGIAFSTVIENVKGSNSVDDIIGNGVANQIDGGGGADTMRGLGGNDLYLVDNAGDLVFEVVGQGTDRISSTVSYTLAAGQSVEGLYFTNTAATTTLNLIGNELAQSLTGNAGNNILVGGGGADTMRGLGGNDTYSVDNVGDLVFEAAGGGTDSISAAVSYSLAAGQSVEVMYLTNAAATTTLHLTGNELNQSLRGNAGTNILVGGGGADTMRGLAGDDFYSVDNAGDLVFEAAGQGTDAVSAAVSYTLGAGQSVEVMYLTNAAAATALNLTGNELAQSLTGNAGNNTLVGGGGADTMRGLGGNDAYSVDNVGDVIFEAAGGGTDRVSTSVSYTLGAGQSIESLYLSNATATTALNLVGNNLAQILSGNAGNNLLDGKGGADTLRGYGGNDSFQFSTALGGGNVDHIADFSAVDDTIRLRQSVFTELGLGTLTSTAYKDIASGTVDSNDRILYDHDTGQLFYDSNGSGAGGRFEFAVLDNKPAVLTAADFLIVA